ncbi:MAG: 16S rRNA (cytidine(1402)-2'-O)-methyltransferase [Anaerolineae bacterium]|nr:MAG: 16S rRNA (cytidine(1402)-2'-O)-methyltransferase [Anaerolineae bacterium]
MGTLYLIATPIGNLEDITLRALRLLGKVDLIAAEDTRHTGRLLAHYGVDTPQISYHEHNKLTRLDAVLKTLETGDVALVSDAGTPGLSDPGYELVRAAISHGVPVVPIPGPSALTAALVASGLPTDAFVYLGFLPRRATDRRRLLTEIASECRTLVAFESPRRLAAALEDVEAVLGDRQVTVARELTKLYEEIWRGPASEARARFAGEVRGEITLVIAGASPPPPWDDQRVQDTVSDLMSQGLSHRQAVKQVSQTSGRSRRNVYQLTVGTEKQSRK